jgi:hypothetical protein
MGATVNQASFQLSAPGSCDIGRIRIYQGREPVNVDGQFPLGVIAKAARLTGVRAISSNYTAVATDATVLASGGKSGLKLTLPSAAVGQRLEVKKVDSAAGHVTIAPASGTIDGAATYTLAARNAAVTCVCDGKLWYII